MLKTIVDYILDAKNLAGIALFIAVALIGLAILGFIPLGTTARIQLSGPQRIGFGILGLAVPIVMIAVRAIATGPTKVDAPTNAEYERRVEETRAKDQNITPETKIPVERYVGSVRFVVIIGDIATAKADVIVSSDDNYFQARGGVAKAILQSAGAQLNRELKTYRDFKPKLGQGDLAVTSGGATDSRLIIHPAVIDLVLDRYPTKPVIRKVVRRCLVCAAAFGAGSIAFPVLAGGTASKHLTPWDSIQTILQECIVFADKVQADFDGNIKNIALYIFDEKDILGDLNALFPPDGNP